MAKILAVAFWPSTKHGRVKSVQVASVVVAAAAAVEDLVVVAVAAVEDSLVVADEVAMVGAALEEAEKNGSVMTVARVDMKAAVAAKNAGDLPHVDFEAEPVLQVPLYIFYRSAHS